MTIDFQTNTKNDALHSVLTDSANHIFREQRAKKAVGLKREVVNEYWIKPNNEYFHESYFSPDVFRW
jgi:hypothetical protein